MGRARCDAAQYSLHLWLFTRRKNELFLRGPGFVHVRMDLFAVEEYLYAIVAS